MKFLQDPAFWAAAAFVIFIAATAKPISRLLTAGLDKRADKIRSDLEEAEKLREEAQDLLASYQRKQRDALAEADKVAAKATDSKSKRSGKGMSAKAGVQGEHWSTASPEEIRASAKTAHASLRVMASSAKKWEAELVSREWRK